MTDSTNETTAHINRVRALMALVVRNLHSRAAHHDESKLEEPEKSGFDGVTGKLKALTYGSPEYKAQLLEMKPFLDHHYAHNSHHPEHYMGGISEMSLFDLIEMFCDWKAATERHADGSIAKSIRINRDRFGISDQLTGILENTRKELGW